MNEENKAIGNLARRYHLSDFVKKLLTGQRWLACVLVNQLEIPGAATRVGVCCSCNPNFVPTACIFSSPNSSWSLFSGFTFRFEMMTMIGSVIVSLLLAIVKIDYVTGEVSCSVIFLLSGTIEAPGKLWNEPLLQERHLYRPNYSRPVVSCKVH